jgi:hypothetical protein
MMELAAAAWVVVLLARGAEKILIIHNIDVSYESDNKLMDLPPLSRK